MPIAHCCPCHVPDIPTLYYSLLSKLYTGTYIPKILKLRIKTTDIWIYPLRLTSLLGRLIPQLNLYI